MGGECPYYGCIPSKMIIRAADLLAEGRRIADFAAVRGPPRLQHRCTHRIRDEATDDWDDPVAVDRLEDAGVDASSAARPAGRSAHGRGRRRDVRRAQGRRAQHRHPPAAPPIDGLADTPYWTNRDILRIESLPASLVRIGGGPIGAELAQALSRFGVRVTVLEVGERILGPEEPESSTCWPRCSRARASRC